MGEYLLVQRRLPDGTVVWEERGKAKLVLDALRAYDPRLSITRNHRDGQWEVWRSNEDRSQGRVAIFAQELLPEPDQAVATIAAHDTWRGYDPIADLARDELARKRAEDARVEEIALASADRMHYELVDEFSAHAPAARPISLAPNGHRKRVTRT